MADSKSWICFAVCPLPPPKKNQWTSLPSIFFSQAYMKQGEFDSARDKFRKAQYYKPSNKEIKDALIELDK